MPIERRLLCLLLLGWAAACSNGEGGEPSPRARTNREPPVPENLEDVGQRVAARIEEALDAVRAAPTDDEAWGNLGKVYEVRTLRPLAIECYEEARRLDPEEPRWSYRLCVSRWRLGEAPAALADIERVLELAPDYAPAHYRLGTLHFDQGELDPAEAAFARCAELDPAFAGGWVGQARVLLQRDRAAEAVAMLEPLQERDPSDGIVAGLLQSAYRQAGSDVVLPEPPPREDTLASLWNDPWEAELNDAREAPEVHQVLTLLQNGQGDEAAAILEERRAAGRAGADDEELLAEAYFQAGRLDDARAIHEALLARDPKSFFARLALARYAEAEGDLRTAVRHQREAVGVEPNHGGAWFTLGRLLFAGQQFEAAVPALERALELDQRHALPRLMCAESKLALRRWAEALADLELYLEREPESGVGHLLRARALWKLDRLDEARAALERARAFGSGRRGLEKSVAEGIARSERRGQRGGGS